MNSYFITEIINKNKISIQNNIKTFIIRITRIHANYLVLNLLTLNVYILNYLKMYHMNQYKTKVYNKIIEARRSITHD